MHAVIRAAFGANCLPAKECNSFYTKQVVTAGVEGH